MEPKGFFSSLFDFSFSEFIVLKIISLLFIIGLAISAIITIMILASAFATSTIAGIITLILSPIIFLIQVIIVRIYLELIIVVFKIAENTKDIAAK